MMSKRRGSGELSGKPDREWLRGPRAAVLLAPALNQIQLDRSPLFDVRRVGARRVGVSWGRIGRLLAAAVFASLIGALPGCGGSSVNLASPPNVAPGAPAPQKPTDPGQAGEPTVPGVPGQPTLPARPPRYWLFCGVNSYALPTTTYDITVLSSTLGTTAHGQTIVFVDPTYPKERPITAFDKNVDAKMPYPGTRVAPYTYRTLFLGRPSRNLDGAFQLYVSDASVANRSGRDAHPIGPGVEASAAAQNAANALGGQTRKYGASSAGRYLFVPAGSGGFTILRGADMANVGRVDVGGDAMMPQMDEASGVFWAWSYGGGGLINRFARIQEDGGRVSVASLGAFGGGSQTPAQHIGDGRFVWAEAGGMAGGLARSLSAVVADPAARASSRFSIEDERGGAFFRPMGGGVRLPDGTPGIVVAEEDIDRAYFPWKARRLEIRVYRLAGRGGAGALEAVANFPQGARDELEKDNPLGLHYENFALMGATSFPDGSQAVLTINTPPGPMTFRVTPLSAGVALVDALGDEVCRWPAMTLNPD